MERTSRFSDEEYGIMKSLFKDDDSLRYLIRKIFFFGGLDSNEIERAEKTFKKQEIFNIIKKVFLPEISNEDPLHQVTDLWATIDLKDRMLDDVNIQIHARGRANTMMREAVERLKNPSSDKLSVLDYEMIYDPTEDHVNLIARNTFINGVTIQLANLKVMSKKDEKTPEEKTETKKLDSSK